MNTKEYQRLCIGLVGCAVVALLAPVAHMVGAVQLGLLCLALVIIVALGTGQPLVIRWLKGRSASLQLKGDSEPASVHDPEQLEVTDDDDGEDPPTTCAPA